MYNVGISTDWKKNMWVNNWRRIKVLGKKWLAFYYGLFSNFFGTCDCSTKKFNEKLWVYSLFSHYLFEKKLLPISYTRKILMPVHTTPTFLASTFPATIFLCSSVSGFFFCSVSSLFSAGIFKKSVPASYILALFNFFYFRPTIKYCIENDSSFIFILIVIQA